MKARETSILPGTPAPAPTCPDAENELVGKLLLCQPTFGRQSDYTFAKVDWGHVVCFQVGRVHRVVTGFVMVQSWSRLPFVRCDLGSRLGSFGHAAPTRTESLVWR